MSTTESRADDADGDDVDERAEAVALDGMVVDISVWTSTRVNKALYT